MSFISVDFLVFILITSIIYYLVCPKKRFLVLLVASIIFYILNSKLLILFLFMSITSIYFGGRFISYFTNKYDDKNIKAKRNKKLILLVVIILNIGILILLKYSNFIVTIGNDIFHSSIPLNNFILPLGISYYTLSAISYIVDIYNDKIQAENNYFKVALYLLYFPYILEGPISKYKDMKEALFNEKPFQYEKYRSAFILIMWGFLKKLVIADRLGILVDSVFKYNVGGFPVFLAVIFYTLQIYAEFSGCMDIVRGTSELFNIELPLNFKTPFFSETIEEFWRRWHITLGTWLKEYIFYPISLSKVNTKLLIKTSKWKNKYLANAVRIAFPLLFVWLVMGIWHGASFKYILYGLYYFVVMMLGVLLKPLGIKCIKLFRLNTKSLGFKVFRIVRTIILVVIGMTIFRSVSFKAAWQMLGSIFTGSSLSILKLGLGRRDYLVIVFYLLVLFVCDLLTYKGYNIRESLEKEDLPFRWLIYLLLIFSVLIFGIYGPNYNPATFIYGGF